MGKHPKYFCSSVRNTVLTISIWMMFSYFVATVVTIGFCVIGDTPGMRAFTLLASIVYLTTTVKNSLLICVVDSPGEKFFREYNMIVGIAIVFTFIDGILKVIFFHYLIGAVYILLGIFGCYTLFIMRFAKKEIAIVEQEAFENIQHAKTVEPVEEDGNEKFTMPIWIDGVEVKDVETGQKIEVWK